MKITFLEDHQSVLSGNEFYQAGSQADLRRGKELVDSGVAYEGWKSPPVAPVSTLDMMSDDDLKALAKDRGIKGHARMRRETLIAKLTDDNS